MQKKRPAKALSTTDHHDADIEDAIEDKLEPKAKKGSSQIQDLPTDPGNKRSQRSAASKALEQMSRDSQDSESDESDRKKQPWTNGPDKKPQAETDRKQFKRAAASRAYDKITNDSQDEDIDLEDAGRPNLKKKAGQKTLAKNENKLVNGCFKSKSKTNRVSKERKTSAGKFSDGTESSDEDFELKKAVKKRYI